MANDDVNMPKPNPANNEPGGGGPGGPQTVSVRLERTGAHATADQPLWAAIRNRTQAISFPRYAAFIEALFCEEPDTPRRGRRGKDAYSETEDFETAQNFGSPSVVESRERLERRPSMLGVDSYNLLKLATEAFLVLECGIAYRNGTLFQRFGDLKGYDELTDDVAESRRFGRPVDADEIASLLSDYLGTPNGTYLRRIAKTLLGTQDENIQERLPYCDGILQNRLSCPSLIELIWSYWHEQGMLVQTINAILLRFQNKRHGPDDPLVNLELDPLRGLNNLLWGFLQDEANRLSVPRRAYEYDHHYGLHLEGKSIAAFYPIDSRARFIEAFHTLLYRAMMFFREDDDTTVVADGFAMLNALREVHIILGEGAHNQYGDLPWQARKEMLISQWLLSRREIREFIRGRHMVPYQEAWMGSVDDMKRLQSWSDVTVTHFHELAVYGEEILLSVRYGDWIDINDQEYARNWARYWRPEIQRYIHAYHAVTGVDLSLEITDSRSAEDRSRQPSALIESRDRARRPRRLISQGRTRPIRTEPPRDRSEPAPARTPVKK